MELPTPVVPGLIEGGGRPAAEEEIAMVEWDSPDWGKPGSNVHLSQDGSWWDRRDERSQDWTTSGRAAVLGGQNRALEKKV